MKSSLKLEKLVMNFQANSYSDVRNKMFDLSEEIAEHTLCLILFPDNENIVHWRIELLAWLKKLQSYNNVKTKSKKLGYGPTYSVLYEGPYGNYQDLIIMINRANEHSDKKVNPNRINEDNYRTSLEAIYDDYCKFINKMMTETKLKSRMENYYLYQR